ncbi:MAG: Trk system potassium transporter TrkA [Bacteroidales bacterium]
MNIVIAGDGEFGISLTKLLVGKTHNIVFIDSFEKKPDYIIEDHSDIIAIKGSATSVKILEEANVRNADLMISVVHDEKVNLISCLLSKNLGAKKTIARVSSLEYFQEDILASFKKAGVDELVCPEMIAVDECINLISHVVANEVQDFSGKMLSLMMFRVENKIEINESVFFNEDSTPKDFKIMLAKHKNSLFIPIEGDELKKGDYFYALTKPKGKQELLDLLGLEYQELNNLMIVGGGRVGRMLASRIEDKFNIRIIESNLERCNSINDMLSNTLVINGDARNVDVLEEENIRGMDGFIAVTDNSETNILTCMLAKRYGVKKVIALMDNIEYIDLAQRIGIDGILNRKLITSSYMTRFTLEADVSDIKSLIGIDAQVIEISAKQDSYVTKKPVGKLSLPDGILIGGVIRGYESHIATNDFQIRPDDKVIVMCLPEAIIPTIKLFNKRNFF